MKKLFTLTMSALMLAASAAYADTPTVTTMPANGATVSQTVGIQVIYITVSGYKFDEANTGVGTITKNGAAYATFDTSTLGKGMDNASVLLTLPTAAQMNTAGSYVVSLPEGFFYMKSSADDTYSLSPAIELNYTISAPSEPLSWTVSPEPGEVEKIDRVSVTFNKPVKLKNETYPDVNLFWSTGAYFMETITQGRINLSEDGLVANLDFTPAFEMGGVFQIRLYEGEDQLIVVDGEKFPGMELTYKVNAPLNTVCVPEAGSTVESVQEVKIKLPYNVKIAKADFSATLQQGEKSVPATLEKIVEYNWGDPSYIIVKGEEAITTPGEVILTVAAGSLTITNYGESMSSPEIKETFVIAGESGVNTLEAAEAQGVVYNTQGVCVGKSLEGLAPGVYVRGGKKVVVK